MKFRPCIDLHNGQVKQIVGSTLTDTSTTSSLQTNFSTSEPASSFAARYSASRLPGGHIIMLGPGNESSALSALSAYPNGMQVGGGVTSANARQWIEAGASHVIVTSFVFKDGKVDYEALTSLVEAAGGKQRVVLDLSCRRKQGDGGPDDGLYYVVTDRWVKYTDVPVTRETLSMLATYCDEFLVHGVENEGKRCGILEDLVVLLGECSPIAVTYAGGVSCYEDLEKVKELGKGRVDLTIGSALDLFGGDMEYDKIVEWHYAQPENQREENSSS